MLDEKEKAVQEKAAEVANVNALINVVQRSITHAHENNECILCERPFVANEAANFFGVQQRAVQEDLPTARGEHELALTEANNAIAALVRARPLWEECQKMKDRDIPKAEELHKGCVYAALLHLQLPADTRRLLSQVGRAARPSTSRAADAGGGVC